MISEAELKMKIFLRVLVTFALIGLSRTQYYDVFNNHYGDYYYDIGYGKSGNSQHGQKENCFWQDVKDFGVPPRYYPRLDDYISLSHSCACGKDNKVKSMIRNGQEVYPTYRYPWMVSLQLRNNIRQIVCGGSLISERHVLSAAHCFIEEVGAPAYQVYSPKEMQISFVTRTYQVSPGPPIQKIIIHPKFDNIAIKNDIAVVILRHKVICSRYRRPICLPSTVMNMKLGQEFTTAGWGTEHAHSTKGSDKLMETFIRTVEMHHCDSVVEDDMKQNVFCLKGVNDSSPCRGDSGGPMFAEYQCRAYLFGVVSTHTDIQCDTKSAFVYTRVDKYLNWIKSVMQKGSFLSRPLTNARVQNGGQRRRCKKKFSSRKHNNFRG